MTDYTNKYGIKTNLSLNDINPMAHPSLAVTSLFLSLLIQRSHMKRYLLIKARTLSAFSILVNYSCLYYVLFNTREIYNTYNSLK
jgi:hypothetical protein